MKKVLSIVLSAVILLSALCFVSCDSEPEIAETINGMKAKDAVAMALKKLEETERYRVIVDAEIKVNAIVTSISAGKIENFYENTTDGDNMHYKFTDEDLLFIDNEQIFSLIKGYDKEVWYVDGTRYSVNTAGENVVDDSGDRKPSNVVEKMIDSISEEELNSAVAYLDNGQAYVLVTINIEEFNVGAVSCKIFLNESNQLSEVILEGNLYGLGAVVTLNFEYGNVANVTAPKDFKPADKNNGNNGDNKNNKKK